MDATITAITTGAIGPSVTVKLTGVVAMSHKFLVSKGSSGSCLWGVYVSEPNLGVTAPSSGIRLLSYGFNAAPGSSSCPKLGVDPTGDHLPDDTKPGDVLDVLGETAYFVAPQCSMTPGEPQVGKVLSAIKAGTAPVPQPHLMSGDELAKLVLSGDPLFRSQWVSVKIRIQDVVSEPSSQAMSIVDQFGILRVHDVSIASPVFGEKLLVGTKLFSSSAQPPSFCHGPPAYANLETTFSAIDGIGEYQIVAPCNLVLQTSNRCLDYIPPSDSCTDPMACN